MGPHEVVRSYFLKDIDVLRDFCSPGVFFAQFVTHYAKEGWSMKTTYKRFLALAVVMLIALGGQLAMAQSTIFNIPTTDTVAKGKAYFEFDYLGQVPGPDPGDRYNVFMPRGVFGVANNVEAGVNLNFTHVAGSTQSLVQPNLKWKFFNDDKGVAASMGGIAYLAGNNRDFVRDFEIVYGNVSKKVKSGNYGPRFTAGPYATIGPVADHTGGVILGFEQPIHAKASIVADWFSGKNYFGTFTPGVSITMPASGLLNIGYAIGNDSWENSNAVKDRYLFIYYGITF